MKCPVCKEELYEYEAGPIKADICRDGCAGIFLDEGEFDKVDNFTERFPCELLRINRSPNVLIDRSLKRPCPKCPDSIMKRVVIDPDLRFEIDHCPTCRGDWFDLGELEHIRVEDEEMTAINGRLAAWEKRVKAQLKDIDGRRRVRAFVELLFK